MIIYKKLTVNGDSRQMVIPFQWLETLERKSGKRVWEVLLDVSESRIVVTPVFERS
jgi:hypothetical protein